MKTKRLLSPWHHQNFLVSSGWHERLLSGLDKLKKKLLVIPLGCAFFCGYGQCATCQDCSISSFAAITVYTVFQAKSDFGLGMEAGTWNKTSSRFSFFVGTKMQWYPEEVVTAKGMASEDKIQFAAYLKAQFALANRFYLLVSPEFVDLSSFETAVAVRYVLPVTKYFGLGLEPTYLIIKKDYSLTVNFHFAL
jgi:hypothetical protein